MFGWVSDWAEGGRVGRGFRGSEAEVERRSRAAAHRTRHDSVDNSEKKFNTARKFMKKSQCS